MLIMYMYMCICICTCVISSLCVECDGDSVEVKFIDFGNTGKVHSSSLFQPSKKLLKIPPLVCC